MQTFIILIPVLLQCLLSDTFSPQVECSDPCSGVDFKNRVNGDRVIFERQLCDSYGLIEGECSDPFIGLLVVVDIRVNALIPLCSSTYFLIFIFIDFHIGVECSDPPL
jgi:hypothetical protein